MLKGILYTALSKYSGVFISLIITAILARLLTPSEFGIVALVTVFITFFGLLGQFGLGPAIIQRKDLSNDEIRSIFSVSIVIASLLAAVFFISASSIADFYEETDLIDIVQLLSFSVFFNIVKIVPNSLLLKDLQFKKIGIINVSVQTLTGLITIALAYQGFSYFALVFKSIIDGLFLFVIFFTLRPVKPVLIINKEAVKKIASFSSYQFGFNFINYFSRNLDNILIGKFLGNTTLGYYDKSYALMMLPVSNLTNVITPVLHPVLSNYQNDKLYIYKVYKKIIKILALLGFPLGIFLFFAAPELIKIIFGAQWDASIPVFEILAFTVGFQVCLSSSGSIFQALNRTDLLFLSGTIGAIVMVSGISYGIFIGNSITAVGHGLIVAFTINFFQGFYILIKHALKQSFFDFLKLFFTPLAFTCALFILLYLLNLVPFSNIFLTLFLKVLLLCFILIIAFLSSRNTRDFFLNKIIKKKKKL
jgi:teichuronic acid exporter